MRKRTKCAARRLTSKTQPNNQPPGKGIAPGISTVRSSTTLRGIQTMDELRKYLFTTVQTLLSTYPRCRKKPRLRIVQRERP